MARFVLKPCCRSGAVGQGLGTNLGTRRGEVWPETNDVSFVLDRTQGRVDGKGWQGDGILRRVDRAGRDVDGALLAVDGMGYPVDRTRHPVDRLLHLVDLMRHAVDGMRGAVEEFSVFVRTKPRGKG